MRRAASQRALGRGDVPALDAHRVPQGPGHRLERGLEDVVGILPVTSRMWRVSAAAVAKARQNSSANWGSKGGVPSPAVSGANSMVYARNGRPDRSSATSTRASSRGSEIEANRLTPTLSPSASASTSPRAIPTSSTVWWASTSRSPTAATRMSMPLCLPSWLTIWSKNGSPVAMSVSPVPSRSISTSIEVSLVARDTWAARRWGRSGRSSGRGAGAGALIAGFRSGRPGTGRSPRGAPRSPAGTR